MEHSGPRATYKAMCVEVSCPCTSPRASIHTQDIPLPRLPETAIDPADSTCDRCRLHTSTVGVVRSLTHSHPMNTQAYTTHSHTHTRSASTINPSTPTPNHPLANSSIPIDLISFFNRHLHPHKNVTVGAGPDWPGRHALQRDTTDTGIAALRPKTPADTVRRISAFARQQHTHIATPVCSTCCLFLLTVCVCDSSSLPRTWLLAPLHWTTTGGMTP